MKKKKKKPSNKKASSQFDRVLSIPVEGALNMIVNPRDLLTFS